MVFASQASAGLGGRGKRLAALWVLSSALVALALTAPAASPIAGIPSKLLYAKPDPNVAGSWAGTTSEGLPVSFRVNRRRVVKDFSIEMQPIQCQHSPFNPLADPTTQFPEVRVKSLRERKRGGALGRWTTFFAMRVTNDLIYTADANFVLYADAIGAFTKKRTFRGTLDISLKWAGPNHQVGRCPATTSDPDFGSVPTIDWTARRK